MTTSADIARLFLTDVGAPLTDSNVRAIEVWLRFENSNPTLRNNPWNLHSSGGLAGQVGSVYVGSGDRNVAVFDTIEHGVAANASNLTRLSYYRDAVSELRSGDGAGFLAAIAASPWSAGHYRTTVGTGNKLLNAFEGSGSYGGSVGQSGGSAATGWSPSASLVARAAAGTPASALASPGGAATIAGNGWLWAALAAVVLVAAAE